MEVLSGEIVELLEAQEILDDNDKTELSLIRLDSGKYVVIFKHFLLTNDESGITLVKEFDSLDDAKEEYKFYTTKE